MHPVLAALLLIAGLGGGFVLYELWRQHARGDDAKSPVKLPHYYRLRGQAAARVDELAVDQSPTWLTIGPGSRLGMHGGFGPA